MQNNLNTLLNKTHHKENEISFEFVIDDICFRGGFFGHGHSMPDLKKRYNGINLVSLNQTHSDKFVLQTQVAEKEVNADAHWTTTQKLGLVVKTADCLPLLLFSPSKKICVAIHAGWKGVANQIIMKTLLALKNDRLINSLHDFVCLIGPHIRQPSFAIDRPVLDQLLLSLPRTTPHLKDFYIEMGSKFYFDMESAARTQLQSLGVRNENILSASPDTLTQTHWNSFRRDKDKSERNLSFIFWEPLKN